MALAVTRASGDNAAAAGASADGPTRSSRVVQEQYDLSRRDDALRRFLEAAFNRIVEPMQRQGPKARQLPPRKPPAAEAAADRDYPAP